MDTQYKKTYLISIALIAVLIIAHQFAIQFWVDARTNNADIINDSRRQGMLSQRLEALIYNFNLTKDSLVKAEIHNVHEEIEMVHNGLMVGNKEKGILLINEPFRTRLRALTPKVKFSEYLIENIDSLNQVQIRALQNNQDFFLNEMESIVSGLERAFNKKTQIVLIAGVILLILVFVILYVEHQYVYKKIMEKVFVQNEELSNKNEMLEHYAYIASHDLQEPLRTVDNFIDAYKEDYGEKMEKGEQEYFKFIQDATARMKQMIRGLLIYSKVGKSGDHVSIDLNKMVKELEIDFSKLFETKKAKLVYHNLPKIVGLKTEIRQLFQNLINNAIKFNRPGIPPEVKISFKEHDTHWQFCISDNGIGIDSKNKKAIFQLFTKLHSDAVYQGQGLGLAFCKKAVELHEGKIWIDSKVGEGSSFYFTLKKEK